MCYANQTDCVNGSLLAVSCSALVGKVNGWQAQLKSLIADSISRAPNID